MKSNQLTGKPLGAYQRELVEALDTCPHPEGALEWVRHDGKTRAEWVWCARCGAFNRHQLGWESPTYGEDDDGK